MNRTTLVSMLASLSIVVLLMTSTSFSTLLLAQSSANTTSSGGNATSKLSSANIFKNTIKARTTKSLQGSSGGNATSKLSSANIFKNITKTPITKSLQDIQSFSNIVGVSMVNGIKISGINFGDTDLSVTLSQAANSTTANKSLPVTVIVAKFPVNQNLTELLSMVQSLPNLAASARQGASTNSSGAAPGELGSSTPIPIQLLSLLKNTQISAGSIVNPNWTLPQTISMGLIGPGNRVATSAANQFVLVAVVPFLSEGISTTVQLR